MKEAEHSPDLKDHAKFLLVMGILALLFYFIYKYLTKHL